jgi:cytochrome c oxidase assembly protein subunit 15
MDAQALYDFSPWARLLGGATLLGSLPMVWLWWRYQDAPRMRRLALTLLTLFLTFDLVMVGAFTRLTDSGLGCPDWPGCYGHATPMGASTHIADAQQAMPSGPVTQQKAWIEMVHRYLAMAVGALIVVLTCWAWWDRWQSRGTGLLRQLSPWWATATLFWVCVQGLFGALTVTMKLFPAIVSLHLLGAYGLLGLLVVQAVGWGRGSAGEDGRHLRALVALGLGVVVLQAMLGAWVSTNYAVLACSEFPLCQGQWWPAMDFAAGFEIWRPLGSSADGAILSFQALTAIHYGHRLFALVAFAVLAWVYWRLRTAPHLQSPRRYLGLLLLAQLVTGLSNVVLDWPLAAAVLHTGGAGALIAVLTWLYVLTFTRATPTKMETV